jgi:hypothetical protein
LPERCSGNIDYYMPGPCASAERAPVRSRSRPLMASAVPVKIAGCLALPNTDREGKDLKRAERLTSTIGVLCAALFLAVTTAAVAQSPLLKSERSASDPSPPLETTRGDMTVESASRDAQRAIRACDDRVALRCVADVLAEYAKTLRAISDRRGHTRRPFRRPAGASARLRVADRLNAQDESRPRFAGQRGSARRRNHAHRPGVPALPVASPGLMRP